MKAFRFAVPLLVAAWGFFASPAWAISVTNFSFEDPVTGGFTTTCPNGWTCSSTVNIGVYHPVSPTQYANNGTNGLAVGKIVPDGSQAGYANVNTISQITTTPIAANTTYTLDVWAGCRADPGFCNSWPSDTKINLVAGNTATVVASLTLGTPGLGKWADYSVSYTPLAGDPNLGKFLGISLFSNSSSTQTNWDDVTLNATVPEPATMFLGGSALIAFGYAARRRVFGK